MIASNTAIDANPTRHIAGKQKAFLNSVVNTKEKKKKTEKQNYNVLDLRALWQLHNAIKALNRKRIVAQ